MRKQTKTLAVLSAAALFAAAAPIMTNTGTYRVLAAQSGWTEEDGRLYYYDEDGYKETNTWKKRNGDWFYLDEEGEIATNQRVDDYFVNDEGHMAKNQWVSAENEIGYDSPDSPDGGSWLYFGKDGKIVTAKWMSINGKTYYFDEDGLMPISYYARDFYAVGFDMAAVADNLDTCSGSLHKCLLKFRLRPLVRQHTMNAIHLNHKSN